MIGDPHPTWKGMPEFERLRELLDRELGADAWELVSVRRGEDLCTTYPDPVGCTGFITFRFVKEQASYGSRPYWDLHADS